MLNKFLYVLVLTALVACQGQETPTGTTSTTSSNTLGSTDPRLNQVYYDGERVYYQIASYTGNTAFWNACAAKAEALYRDQYAIPSTGATAGYWVFTKGLRLDFERTGDTLSRTTAELISQNSPFSRDGACCPAPSGYNEAGQEFSREVAYTINSYMDTEALGFPVRVNKNTYIGFALGHIDQWFTTFTNPISGQWWIQPFMVGLTMRALMQVYDDTPPASRTADMLLIPSYIKKALDGLWTGNIPGATPGQGARLNTTATSTSFFYATFIDAGSCGATPCIQLPADDLNLLIAPAFAWYYLQTGDTTYRTRGDQVFAGGVTGAFLGNGKQFDQNYIYSIDYVTWREAADVKYSGGDTTPPSTPIGLKVLP